MKQYIKSIICLLAISCCLTITAQNTVRIDATKTHQRITGFGGFVCSPSFQYNHMSNAEIDKVWGEESMVGCNIMRLYIPIGRNAWSQSLATPKSSSEYTLNTLSVALYIAGAPCMVEKQLRTELPVCMMTAMPPLFPPVSFPLV